MTHKYTECYWPYEVSELVVELLLILEFFVFEN